MPSPLFTPFQLGSVTIPNRLGMSSLTRNRSSATVPNELMKQYYDQRACGGAGLIVSEGVLITRQGTEWPNAPGIWDKVQVREWKKITSSVQALGSKIYAQLWHLGRISHPEAPEQIAAGVPVYAPSAISARGGRFRFIEGCPGYVTPTEIQDPTILIAQFKQAAVNAKEAGFDGVELHGASGFLVHQFLDSTSNKRTDNWGGSVQNRARFALETLKALIEVYGCDVAIKLSPTGGYNDMGMPLKETIDTFSYLLREINRLSLSYVCLVRFNAIYHDPEYDGKKRAIRHDVLETYAPFLGNTPIFINSEVTPAEAEELVGSGRVAGVFLGIDWITHPDLGRRIQAEKALDNVPDYGSFYGTPGMDPAVGYIDYKVAVTD
ncbi:hypothetical protein FB45DRAFT_753025 [Roridomyces roridus]|uniref:NADH:flavin oxidoreductase/NADH oxidase N-terminal domain-containing protein n=1 Tax=Roridomyces roridus TaxID=1738132 RepID=A0AAD7BK07_9AGAR|nr:hypothetical protein FB45DRAFT_753025 [Roridomyces roridus]